MISRIEMRLYKKEHIDLSQGMCVRLSGQGVQIRIVDVQRTLQEEGAVQKDDVVQKDDDTKRADAFPEMDAGEKVLLITDEMEMYLILQKSGCAVAFWQDEEDPFPSDEIDYLILKAEELDAKDLDRIYRRLTGEPWDILETERLLVRETMVRDVDDFYRIYKDAQITKYMEDLFPDPEQERDYIRSYIRNIYSFYEYGIWTVVRKEDRAVIGRAGMEPAKADEYPELGFVIGTAWQRKGYAKEALEAIIRYAAEELGIMTLQASVHELNRPSRELLEKLGLESVKTDKEGRILYQTKRMQDSR